MEEIDLLAESIIKIEEIKEEPVDKKEDCCWNSIVKEEHSPLQHSIKEDCNKYDVKEEPSALQHSIIDDDTDEVSTDNDLSKHRIIIFNTLGHADPFEIEKRTNYNTSLRKQCILN